MKAPLEFSLLIATAGFAGLVSQTHAASTLIRVEALDLSSSNAPASSTNFNISVESSYQGYKGTANDSSNTLVNVNNAFYGSVTAYRFWNAVSSAPNTLAESGGIISDLTTTDASVNNFGNARIWTTTAPNGSAFDTTQNFANNIGDITDFSGSVDITGISSGSFYIFYGAYRSTPNISISMTGSGTALDIDTDPINIHNGDFANNNEYYVTRVDFTNEDGYTSLDWGTAGAANYRFSGVVLTEAIPEPSTALLVAFGLLAFRCRGR